MNKLKKQKTHEGNEKESENKALRRNKVERTTKAKNREAAK